jgi:hypothetical protein
VHATKIAGTEATSIKTGNISGVPPQHSPENRSQTLENPNPGYSKTPQNRDELSNSEDRDMVDILALVLQHEEHKVEQAIITALTSGSPSKQHVINCLNRLLDKPLPSRLKPRPDLKLVKEPEANTERYDNLREKRHVR